MMIFKNVKKIYDETTHVIRNEENEKYLDRYEDKAEIK